MVQTSRSTEKDGSQKELRDGSAPSWRIPGFAGYVKNPSADDLRAYGPPIMLPQKPSRSHEERFIAGEITLTSERSDV